MLCNEVLVEDVLHVASIEEGVGDVIDFRVHLRILNRLWHIFNANNLTRLLGHEIGNRTRSCV